MKLEHLLELQGFLFLLAVFMTCFFAFIVGELIGLIHIVNVCLNFAISYGLIYLFGDEFLS